MSFLPIILFVVNITFWYILSKVRGQSISRIRILNRSAASITIFMYIYYPFIIETLFASVNCFSSQAFNKDPDSHEQSQDVYRLYSAPEILCFEGTNLVYMWLVSIPGIILWVFVSPVLLLRYMTSEDQLK